MQDYSSTCFAGENSLKYSCSLSAQFVTIRTEKPGAVKEGRISMPIYEYRCQDCGRVSSYLILNIRDPFQPACKRCHSQKMTRLISRIARVRSEESRLESLADPSKLGDLDDKDPASMARWMKRMGKELGEEMPEDFDALVEQAMEEESADSGSPTGAEGDIS